MLDYQIIPSTGQKYHFKGTNPKLLLVSGLHGDESEVVPIVEKVVEKYYEQLPDFLYVPAASPSALKLGTRKNGDGVDLNRSFKPGTTIPEAKALMGLWGQFVFELFIEIHEDPEFDVFYLYDGEKQEDNKYNILKTKKWANLQKDILALGVKLYNGIDDPEDPDLGYMVTNGYAHWPMTHNDHGAENWLMIDECRSKHVLCPEIPGKADLKTKSKIVDAIFRRLILQS